jgi:tetratricopeptide (TPR) repeat protein
LGDVTRAEGNYEEASSLYRKAIELATQLEDQPQRARILLSQAQLHTTLGQKQKAINLLQNALALYEKIGDPRNTIAASLLLARLHWQQRQILLTLQQVVNTLKITRQAGFLQLSLLLGIWKRRGKW